MLDPRSRGALLEALRPPPGYVVDTAVAATYSLDLVALLTAPLAFSLYDRLAAREGDGPERLDSFALLHAVRQHAEKLVVFCDAGCIAAPKGYRQLIAYLEDSVVQVKAPNPAGAFHPKVWVIRLTSPDEPVRYRVLVLSRNLTFDRSWDTIFSLEGALKDRTNAISESKPLAAFVAALPGLAIGPMNEDRRRIVASMAEEIARVQFELPEPFESFRFWPIGLPGKWPYPFKDQRIQRLFVMSPFLAAGRLDSLAEEGTKHVLVSRLEELQQIPKKVLAKYSEVHVLDDPAEELEDDVADQTDAVVAAGPVPPARGLHAKLYVVDDGHKGHLFTGSANASDAAFELNVEMLVQLTSTKKYTGVEAFLGPDAGLRPMLVPFKAPDEPILPSAVEKQLEAALNLANRAIARARWAARIESESGGGKTETFAVTLRTEDPIALPDACTVRVWPIALPADRALPFATEVRFASCSLQAITAFFAFEVTAQAGVHKERSAFVVRAALTGVPADRNARILHGLLDDPGKVLRFLQMLLALDGEAALELLDPPQGAELPKAKGKFAASNVPLFESLVRTLEREPERLDEVDRLVRELSASEDGKKLLPPDFERIWKPVWETHQARRTR